MFNSINLESSKFHGLTGEILDFTSVRGSTVGNLIHHLTFFGAALGSYPHVEWRGKKYSDMNCILVGTSGCGKGESLGIIRDLYDFPPAQHGLLAPTRNTSLTSGKRTIQAINAVLQQCQNGETRFLSIDEECSAQINSADMRNNTLAQVLIKFIDGNAVTEPCNGRTITIPPLHFGSIGHITPMVLRATLRHMAFFNGLGNRFLYMGIPTPEFSEDDGSYSPESMRALQQKLIESLNEGGARQRVEMDDEAREVFLHLAHSLSGDTSTERIRALQQRLPDMCLKLALTLALVNREATITRQTMEEARAIIDYSRQTIDKLFGATEEETPVQAVLKYLTEQGRTQRTPLMQALTRDHDRKAIERALNMLVNEKRILQGTEVVERGRRPEFFELAPTAQN